MQKNKMIKKSTIILLLAAIFSLQINGQEVGVLETPIKECSMGLGVGVTQFYGDLMEDEKLSPAFSLQLTKFIDYNHSLQAEFIMGRLSGENLFSTICDNPYHTQAGAQVQHQREGEMFNAEFMELDVNFIINISSLFDRKVNSQNHQSKAFARNRNLNFLAKVGAGLNIFRSKRQELITGNYINSYGYVWVWEDDYKDAGTKHLAWNNNIVEKTFVLGFITNYKVSEKVALDFSVTSRIGGNDKWDAKISSKDDMFIFYSLGTTIKLSK